jgi:VWFA-related protein
MIRVTSVLTATLLVQSSFAGQLPANSSAVFQSQSHEVLLEVIVRDAHGKIVTKIDPSQVTVFEDGVKQDIRSFRLVPGSEVRAQYLQTQNAPAAVPAVPVANVKPTAPAQSNPLRTVNVVCLILNDVNPETRKFAFDAARKFVDKELRPDTFVGVFSLDASGLRPVFPFSNNRANLVRAIELASVNQLGTMSQSSAAMLNGLSITALGIPLNTSVSTSVGLVTATTAVTSPGGTPTNEGPPASLTAPPPAGVPTNADGSSVADPLGVRGDMGIAVNAGLREIDALTRMVQQLSQLPFQKTVLLMSTGLTRPPDQMDRWHSLIKQANDGGVTFYGLDVYGLGVCQDQPDCPQGTTSAQGGTPAVPGSPVTTPTTTAFALTQSTSGMSQNQSTVGLSRTDAYKPGGSSTQNPITPAAALAESSHQTDYLRFAVLSANTQEALREISESTGGFIIANTNNTEGLLTKVMEDVDTHFELAYRPVSPGDDGHFRKIEVKIAGKDLRVQTRTGYYAVPDTGAGPLTPGDMSALHALDSNPLPFDFGFESKAYRFRSAQGAAQYSIAWEVPVSHLTATAETRERKHRFHAYLLALVKNEQGEIVERVSKDVPADIADNYLAGVHSELMLYEHAVTLKPGRYTVETAVVDQEGNRASTSVFAIENQDQAGPGLSDIALLRRVNELKRAADPDDPFEIPGKRAQPFLSDMLDAGAQPYIYFVVYPEHGKSQTVSLRAQFIKDGKVVSTQSSALPDPDATGAVPMAIQPAAGPGEYEVRIAIDQDQQHVQRSVKYTIAANK